MMRTKLARKYGLGKSVEAYINLAGKQELGCTDETVKRAHDIYTVIQAELLTPTKTMIAAVVLFLASKSTGEHIYSYEWTEKICAYPTLLDNAKKMLPIINQKHIFPKLRDLELGKIPY